MKNAGWMAFVTVAFLAGWGLGRGGTAMRGDPLPDPAPLPAAKTPAKRGDLHAAGRRLREAPQDKPLEEWGRIPAAERAAAMRAWFGSFGFGGPSAKDLEKIRTVVDRWVEEDFDAAWQWAEGLADPVAREFAVVAVAGAISGRDPGKALDCLSKLGEVQRPIDDWRLGRMIHGESNRAVAAGPEAIKAVWNKVPLAGDAVDRASGDYLDLSKVEDLAPYADALREIREAGRRPFTIDGAMREWAKRDPAAATAYLLERGSTERVPHEWRELASSLREARGAEAADAWMLDALSQVPLARRGEFLDRISYLHSPQSILSLDPGLYRDGERLVHATAFVSALLEREDSVDGIMNLLPEAERGEVIGRLRGVTKPGQLAGYLRRQGRSESEISRIIGEASAPWD